MIISKPSSRAFSAIFLFLVLALAGTSWVAWKLFFDGSRGVAFYTLGILGIVVISLVARKAISSYKILTFSKSDLRVRYPLGFREKIYNWDKLLAWRELVITTRGQEYRVIELMFGKGIITSLSNHENLKFEEVKKYLKKRYGKLETREE